MALGSFSFVLGGKARRFKFVASVFLGIRFSGNCMSEDRTLFVRMLTRPQPCYLGVETDENYNKFGCFFKVTGNNILWMRRLKDVYSEN